MRTLNRPMFRYGGPIKEGVMHGIREPKRNGGSMTQRVQPSNDGSRPGYAGFLAPIVYGVGRALARPFGKYVAKRVPQIFSGPNKQYGGTGKKIFEAGFKKKAPKIEFEPNKFGKASAKFFKNDPLAQTVMGGTTMFGKGIQKAGKGIYNTAKYATTTPSGLVFLGAPVTYMAGKYFLSDGTEIKGKDLNKITQGGKKPGENSDMYYKAPEKELTEAEKAKIESDNRIKQMDKYREIMDIKGMSKDAAYKSLIDAGKIIQEGGNLKEQLKSGKLIQNLTQAASKRFDKVGDTEAALRSLIVKGEIDKEMNKDTKALDKEYKQGVIAMNKKKLAGANLSEELSAYRTKNNKNASGKTLAGFVMDKGGEVVSIADSVAVDKHIKGGGDSVSFMELIVAKNIEAGKEIIPGMYVVKDSLITINPDGSVTPNYKIS